MFSPFAILVAKKVDVSVAAQSEIQFKMILAQFDSQFPWSSIPNYSCFIIWVKRQRNSLLTHNIPLCSHI